MAAPKPGTADPLDPRSVVPPTVTAFDANYREKLWTPATVRSTLATFSGSSRSDWRGAIPEAMAYGTATAALKRTIEGDMARVSRDEVRSIVENGGGTAIER